MCKKSMCVLFLLFIACLAQANTVEVGPYIVSQLRIGEGGFHLALSPAPNGCGGGSQYGMHLKLDPNIESYHNEMMSGLLAAYAAGTKLSRIWFRNEGTCGNTHILHLYLLEYEAK